jgi:putative hydrolase of the HAD superfamily
MKFRGILFDINGTLVDILTDEGRDDIYRTLSNLLDYQGISLGPETIRDLYFQLNKEQRRTSEEEYPEFDAVAIFRDIIARHATAFTRQLPAEKSAALPRLLAEVFRAASRLKLELYPGVEAVLGELREYYQLAAVSDGQSAWAVPELRAVGLFEYFNPVIVSGDLGYRKPDPRIFEAALAGMGLTAQEVIFVGNDMHRDVFGAHRLGLKTVFFRSNQGDQEKRSVEPDYIIYDFAELPRAIRFLEEN